METVMSNEVVTVPNPESAYGLLLTLGLKVLRVGGDPNFPRLEIKTVAAT